MSDDPFSMRDPPQFLRRLADKLFAEGYERHGDGTWVISNCRVTLRPAGGDDPDTVDVEIQSRHGSICFSVCAATVWLKDLSGKMAPYHY
jgi:hypothetical protein